MGGTKKIKYRKGSVKIITMDSIAQMSPDESGHVIVAGSHGSASAARHVVRYTPFGCILNDAGKGKHNAGISGLSVFETMGILGAATDCMSARIGEGDDNYNSGIISAFNDKAGKAGVRVGMPVNEAAKRMLVAKGSNKQPAGPFVIREGRDGRIILTDTIAYLTGSERRTVVVGGSHCAHNTYGFVKHLELKGIFLNDAGKGKDDAGISGLQQFQRASIPAGAIDCMTAMIGNSRDAWENGIISAVNPMAQTHGITIGMPAQKAALKLLKVPT